MRGGGVKLIGSEAPVAGSGFYLGIAGDGTSYMYVAPKSSETLTPWGSKGTVRGTTSTTNGVANTNTLYSFGTTAHPAAGYCKTLTTGGYNTWYLPASAEMTTLYSNKAAVPFATGDSFTTTGGGQYYWTSTENNGTYAYFIYMNNGGIIGAYSNMRKDVTNIKVRAARRSVV